MIEENYEIELSYRPDQISRARFPYDYAYTTYQNGLILAKYDGSELDVITVSS